MNDFDVESYSSDSSDSENERLREALRSGKLKTGLNIETDKKVEPKNDIYKMKEKLDELILELPWVERLDMVNSLAVLAPELSVQLETQEQKRANLFKGNKKIPYIAPEVDPVLNDFKRETLFYRQAQTAVIEGIAKMKEFGIPTKRPDIYFAEMAKTDEHMQKIRKHLSAKQEGKVKSERVKQLREQKKMAKVLQREAIDKKQADKSKMLNDLKAFRKGKTKSLDFLEDKKQPRKKGPNKKRQEKDKKFGFGGKKRGMKRNTKESAMDTSDFKLSNMKKGTGIKGGPAKKGAKKRMGKSRRKSTK